MNEMTRRLHTEIEDVLRAVKPLRDLYAEFNQPRSDVQIRAFVVGQHDTPMRQMHQCLLEISIKDRAIRRTQINRRQMSRKMESRDVSQDDRELLQIDIEETDEALLGAVRELQTLIAIYESFEADFSHEDWMAEEREYWIARIIRQATSDVAFCGSIGQGNRESLRQLGIDPTALLAEVRECLTRSLNSGISAPQSPDMLQAGLLTLQNSSIASD